MWWFVEGLPWLAALLAGCPDTLECLDLEYRLSSTFLRFLCWDQYLTGTSACTRIRIGGSNRLVQGDKTQTSGIPAQYIIRHVDHHGAPNDYIQP